MMRYTIVITWLDGSQEVVHADYWAERGGRLIIGVMGRYEYRYIPLTSIREWTVKG